MSTWPFTSEQRASVREAAAHSLWCSQDRRRSADKLAAEASLLGRIAEMPEVSEEAMKLLSRAINPFVANIFRTEEPSAIEKLATMFPEGSGPAPALETVNAP